MLATAAVALVAAPAAATAVPERADHTGLRGRLAEVVAVGALADGVPIDCGGIADGLDGWRVAPR